MSEPTHPTSIRLPDELKTELRSAAEAEERPLASLIVHILKKWLEWRKAPRKKK